MNIVNADIVVVGAGASGLMACMCAARELKKSKISKKIIILDHLDRVGKKILVTGNGKCNLSNLNVSTQNYHSESIRTVEEILNKFDNEKTTQFFHSIGLEIKSDTEGRMYPRCGQASAVLDLMRIELKNLGVDEILNFKITSIEKNGSWFTISSNSHMIRSKSVIIATGGLTTETQGCDGSGYEYLKQFGHSLTNIFPSLCKIKVSNKIVKSLKGMRTRCKIRAIADDTMVKEDVGELQFTEDSLSGICSFQVSRIVSEFVRFKTINKKRYSDLNISLDLMYELNYKETEEFIKNRINSLPFMTVENFFTGVINKRVGQALVKSCNLPFQKKASDLSPEEISLLCKILKNWIFNPIDTGNYRNSQVTAGGVRLSEFNECSLESNKVTGLFACGEVLDVDADCGGFNLQWAWSSGYAAGINAAKSVLKRNDKIC